MAQKHSETSFVYESDESDESYSTKKHICTKSCETRDIFF